MRNCEIVTLIATTFFLVSCETADVMESAPPHDAMSFEDLDQQILNLIGVPTCVDVSSCASMAIGVKPCGGPWRYLVYSRAVTDEEALAAVVDESTISIGSFRATEVFPTVRLCCRRGWLVSVDFASPSGSRAVQPGSFR